MTPERWNQIKSVLAEALDLAPEERDGYISVACADDVDLRREVQMLLLGEQDMHSKFLEKEELGDAAAEFAARETSFWIGRRIGSYHIVELIGTGGMGEVYRAFRADDQYQQEVALKLVRAGSDSGLVIKRFRNERQILAGLEHPNIARLLDGGTTETSTPYLVMELIKGQSITEYCDANMLTVPERLNLFLMVCSAVQYAHQHLVIHRDIKPGNILVTSEGVPKLLDFGIAKILSSNEATQDSTITLFRALTPRYASPEQIRGEVITTATDVYSLGVVLYELLTGQSPYRTNTLRGEQSITAILQSDPAKPSAVKLPEQSNTANFSLKRWGRRLPGRGRQISADLDNIVMMALRKEPQRRYASVEQFAEDIRRSMQNLPVAARKDTARYRASKFIVRHKPGVVAAALVTLILIAGIAITTEEARKARKRFNDVRSLANSLIFDIHDSVRDLPGSTPARRLIVERALQYLNQLSSESAGDLGLQRELAAAYERVGSVQGDYLESNLGDGKATLSSYRKALDLRKQVETSSKERIDRLALAQDYRLVAHQLWANGDPHGAREPIAKAIAISESLNSSNPRDPKILAELAFEYEVSGRIGYPGDPKVNQKMIEDYRKALAVDQIALQINPTDIHTLHGYSMDLSDIGNMLEAVDPAEALKHYQEGLEINKKLTQLSTDVRFKRSIAVAYGNIASVYDDTGDYAHAVENNTRDLAIYQELVRSDPQNALLRQGLAIAYMNTAGSSSRAGNISEALADSRKGLDIMQDLAGSASENAFQKGILAAMHVVRGTILTAANQPEAAIPLIERGRSLYKVLADAGATSVANLGACEVKLGEAALKARSYAQASEHFQAALAIVQPLISREPADLDGLYTAADAFSGLGEVNSAKARGAGLTKAERISAWDDAKSSFTSSLNVWRRIEYPNHTAPSSFQVGDPSTVKKKMKAAESALAALQ
jgi:eukaryotic-like serine/threonine-protein kinase